MNDLKHQSTVFRILSEGEVDLRHIQRHCLYQFQQRPDIPAQLSKSKLEDENVGNYSPWAMIHSLIRGKKCIKCPPHATWWTEDAETTQPEWSLCIPELCRRVEIPHGWKGELKGWNNQGRSELSPGKMTQLSMSPEEPVLLDNPTSWFCLNLCFFVYVSIHLLMHALTQPIFIKYRVYSKHHATL